MHRVRVVDNRELGGGYYLLTAESPFGPEAVGPGQFVMLRAPGRLDPLLPRPFAVFDVRSGANGGPPTVDFFYHVIGKLTRLMEPSNEPRRPPSRICELPSLPELPPPDDIPAPPRPKLLR